MPLARRIERGIDHAQVIAQAFGRATSMRVIRALSQQSGVNQARLDRSARVARSGRMKWRLRARAMCNELSVQRETAVQQWVIVDDVMTTGATLREVAAVIHERAPGARIAAAVVAVA
jgi:predicted amidophosphoribosyltransferase